MAAVNPFMVLVGKLVAQRVGDDGGGLGLDQRCDAVGELTDVPLGLGKYYVGPVGPVGAVGR